MPEPTVTAKDMRALMGVTFKQILDELPRAFKRWTGQSPGGIEAPDQ